MSRQSRNLAMVVALAGLIGCRCEVHHEPSKAVSVTVPEEPPRFTREMLFMLGGSLYLVREPKTGREWLQAHDGGIVEVTSGGAK